MPNPRIASYKPDPTATEVRAVPNAKPPADQAIPLYEDILRTCKAIALHWCGDEGQARHINYLCDTGRFPHFREGSTICARKSVIDRWVALQEVYAMQGKKWGPEDVLKHFGQFGGKDIPIPPK